MTSKNTNYINSLIDYILDIKPYHTKLREIVEEYRFEDSVKVTIDDSQHIIRALLSTIWDKEYYSDGSISYTGLPSFYIRPEYTSDHFVVTKNDSQMTRNTQIPNLNIANTVYIGEPSDGIRLLKKNKKIKVEGLDYYVSQGAYSVKLFKEGSEYRFIETIHDDYGESEYWQKPSLHGFSVSPTAPEETWSIIKINPLAYSRARFTSSTPGLPDEDGFYGKDSYGWGFDIANMDSGADDIDCATDGPSGDNLYYDLEDTNCGFDDSPLETSGVGIDCPTGAFDEGGHRVLRTYYAGELFDDRVNCFDFSNGFDFQLVDLNAPSELWTITAISETELSVVGSVSGPKANATLNVPYNNGIISFLISTTNPNFKLIAGLDIFLFYVLNPGPTLVQNNKDYYNVKDDTWRATAINSSEFIITSSLYGQYPIRATVNKTWSNGEISFTIYSGGYTFIPGDTFTFNTYENAPTYLVYGSLSGMQPPANPGIPYDNGLISFTLKYPEYRAYSPEYSNNTLNLIINDETDFIKPSRSGSVLNNNGQLRFVDSSDDFAPPRRDAWEEEYIITALTPTRFKVASSRRGVLKYATLDNIYSDTFITFKIESGANPYVEGDQFRFITSPHKYRLWYGVHSIIFGKTVRASSTAVFIQSQVNNLSDLIDIDYARYDKLHLDITGIDSLLTMGAPESSTRIALTFNGDNYFPTKDTKVDVYFDNLANEQYKVGTIENNILTFTASFVQDYLPINTKYKLTVDQQGGTHQNRVPSRITESFKIKDLYRPKDTARVRITETFSHSSFEITQRFADDLKAIIDQNFKITVAQCNYENIDFLSGFDSYNFDDEPILGGMTGSGTSSFDLSQIEQVPNRCVCTAPELGFDSFNFDSEHDRSGSINPVNPLSEFDADGIDVPENASMCGFLDNLEDYNLLSKTQLVETFTLFSRTGLVGQIVSTFGLIQTLTPSDLFFNHSILNPNPLSPITMTYIDVHGPWSDGTVIKHVALSEKEINPDTYLSTAPTILILESLPTIANPSPAILEVCSPIPKGQNPAKHYQGFEFDIVGDYSDFVIVIVI